MTQMNEILGNKAILGWEGQRGWLVSEGTVLHVQNLSQSHLLPVQDSQRLALVDCTKRKIYE
jgi:hypothetical protein